MRGSNCNAARFPFLPSLISELGGHRPPLPWLHLPHFGLLKGGVTAVWERPLPFPWRLILPEQDVHLDIASLP